MTSRSDTLLPIRSQAEVRNDDRVTVRLFAAVDCRPARTMITHVGHAIADRPDISLEIVDPWERPDLVVADHVLSMPTTIVMRNGQETTRLTGVRSTARVRKALAQ